jgi:hypothetical protein
LFALAIAASWSAAADATIGIANVAPATKPKASLIVLNFIFISKVILLRVIKNKLKFCYFDYNLHYNFYVQQIYANCIYANCK